MVFAPRANSVSEMSVKSRAIFTAAAERGLHLAVAELPRSFFGPLEPRVHRDRETLTCLRSVLMKPEHLDWIDPIWQILASAAEASLSPKSDRTGRCRPIPTRTRVAHGTLPLSKIPRTAQRFQIWVMRTKRYLDA